MYYITRWSSQAREQQKRENTLARSREKIQIIESQRDRETTKAKRNVSFSFGSTFLISTIRMASRELIMKQAFRMHHTVLQTQQEQQQQQKHNGKNNISFEMYCLVVALVSSSSSRLHLGWSTEISNAKTTTKILIHGGNSDALFWIIKENTSNRFQDVAILLCRQSTN